MKKISERYPEYWDLFLKYREMILYVFFGGCTTLVNIVVYFICSRLYMGTLVSTGIAWFLSVLFAYVTNRIYVFESKSKEFKLIVREMVSFFSCRLSTGLLDMANMYVFVDLLHWNDLLIKVLSNVVVIVLNYAVSKWFIFKRKEGDQK